jgi:putative protease
VVEHYFREASACAIRIEQRELRRGDLLHFRGHTTDFYQRAHRLESDHREVESARAGESVGVAVDQRVREGDRVFTLAPS